VANPSRYDRQAGAAADRRAAIVLPSGRMLRAANDNAAPLRRRLYGYLLPAAGILLAAFGLWRMLS
jgi:hypothetical protein